MNRPHTHVVLGALMAGLGLLLVSGPSALRAGEPAQPDNGVARVVATTQPSASDEAPQAIQARVRERQLWRKLQSTNPLTRARVDSVAAPLLAPPEGPQRQTWLREWSKRVDCRAYWRRRVNMSALDDVLGPSPAGKARRTPPYVTLFVTVANQTDDYVLAFEEEEWMGLSESVLCHGLGTIHPRHTNLASTRVVLPTSRTVRGQGDQRRTKGAPPTVQLRVPLKARWNRDRRVNSRRAKKLRKLVLELALMVELSDRPEKPLSRVHTQLVVDGRAERRHRRQVQRFLKR